MKCGITYATKGSHSILFFFYFFSSITTFPSSDYPSKSKDTTKKRKAEIQFVFYERVKANVRKKVVLFMGRSYRNQATNEVRKTSVDFFFTQFTLDPYYRAFFLSPPFPHPIVVYSLRIFVDKTFPGLIFEILFVQ